MFTPHTDSLNFAKLAETVAANYGCEDARPRTDADETKVGFFDKVLEVHTVETSDKGTRANTECTNAEFQIEQHQGIAIGVKDSFDSGSP